MTKFQNPKSRRQVLYRADQCHWQPPKTRPGPVEVLGKGHARSGDACVLDGYCGDTEKPDNAIAEFAICYADQIGADYELFTSAVKKGRLPTAKGAE